MVSICPPEPPRPRTGPWAGGRTSTARDTKRSTACLSDLRASSGGTSGRPAGGAGDSLGGLKNINSMKNAFTKFSVQQVLTAGPLGESAFENDTSLCVRTVFLKFVHGTVNETDSFMKLWRDSEGDPLGQK